MRAERQRERQRERTPSDDHRIVGVASGACDSRARGGGLSFASRLEHAEDEFTCRKRSRRRDRGTASNRTCDLTG